MPIVYNKLLRAALIAQACFISCTYSLEVFISASSCCGRIFNAYKKHDTALVTHDRVEAVFF